MKNELRILCRLAWNNWPDNENSRREIAAHEARDPVSAASWDRVIDAVKSALQLDAPHNSGERDPSVMPGYGGADTSHAANAFEECALIADRRSAKLRAKAKDQRTPITAPSRQSYFAQAIEAKNIANVIRSAAPLSKAPSAEMKSALSTSCLNQPEPPHD